VKSVDQKTQLELILLIDLHSMVPIFQHLFVAQVIEKPHCSIQKKRKTLESPLSRPHWTGLIPRKKKIYRGTALASAIRVAGCIVHGHPQLDMQ
jgi:hypothetical protein